MDINKYFENHKSEFATLGLLNKSFPTIMKIPNILNWDKNKSLTLLFLCSGFCQSEINLVREMHNSGYKIKKIMFIDCKRIIKTCNNACVFHWNLIENMLSMIARKNIMLNQKMEILSKRTTREKLLAFFNTQVQMNHSKKFSIPYNREGLAFYLCVDRSALSRELSNMRDEGLLKFNKNEFEIL